MVRTLDVGHPLTQGTVDSNEIWVELIARQGDRVVGRSGGIGPDGTVDPYAHFINVYMLDRYGKRIDRRNAQDIFVPLYNKQIPPGAGQVVHFGLEVPRRQTGPITLEAKVNYRKFDRKYMDYHLRQGTGARAAGCRDGQRQSRASTSREDRPSRNEPSPIKDEWQRWNDYGIGLLLEGATKGGQKGELKQAEEVFLKVAELGRADGWVNLARVYQREGRIPEALTALEKASAHKEPAAPWVINWLTGQINASNNQLEEAVTSFEAVLKTRIPERKFDFSLDFQVIDELASVLYTMARPLPIKSPERQGMAQEGNRRLSPHPGHRLRGCRGALRTGARFRRPGLGRPVTGEPCGPRGPSQQAAVDPDELIRLAAAVADRKAEPAQRKDRALELARLVVRFMKGPRPRFQSRLEPLHDLSAMLGPIWEQEADGDVQGAIGRALETTHKALHERLKQDETAEGRVFAIARKNDPAANMNAQSIVIHSLHRPGAPGIDPAPVAAATAATKPTKLPITSTPVHAQESGE